MAETRVQPSLSPTYWDDKFNTEFFQNNPFSAYAGTGTDNPIVMKEDFASKRGNGITFEWITNLERGVIRGYQPLSGHESQLGEYGDRVFWDMRKNGIRIHELDADLAAIDLRKAGKATLKQWADDDVKYETIDRLQDVGASLNVPYATAATADVNAWQSNNLDRIWYGGGSAALVAGSHATSLGNITAAGGRLTRAAVSAMKRVALRSRPHITPIDTGANNARKFIGFAHPFLMRDLVADMNESERQVSLQDKNQRLFLGGDRDWDGVIIHEVDDMPLYPGVGNGGTDVAPFFLLGQEALAWAIKSRYSSRTDDLDYDQSWGLGMIGKWGMKKAGYTMGSAKTVISADGIATNVIGKQRGMVSGFFACVKD